MSEEIKQRIAEEAKVLGFHSLGVTAIPVNLRREYYCLLYTSDAADE